MAFVLRDADGPYSGFAPTSAIRLVVQAFQARRILVDMRLGRRFFNNSTIP
jgi:hypothetical protein